MITWNEQYTLTLPYAEAAQQITIAELQHFFPEVLVNKYLPDQNCYQQTAQVLHKKITYKLCCTDFSTTDSSSYQQYQTTVHKQVDVHISFTLEALNAHQTCVTYQGSITPTTDNKAVKIGLTTLKKQILKHLVTTPIKRMQQL